ncbi:MULTISPECIES: hypothetical protein [Pseudomonas]|uniref:Uncharacterized protein n=1 Tax=Pseudomonas putida TaxID=303 RepID=A0A1B2F4F0_PSEPU|nr:MULTISPECIES: hypothetical protein [Pseudomonas]ANY86943.1 hypothetical protein IEC33019_1375 [Pseudomonas putida]
MNTDTEFDELNELPQAREQPEDDPEVMPDDPDLQGLPGEDKLPG